MAGKTEAYVCVFLSSQAYSAFLSRDIGETGCILGILIIWFFFTCLNCYLQGCILDQNLIDMYAQNIDNYLISKLFDMFHGY